MNGSQEYERGHVQGAQVRAAVRQDLPAVLMLLRDDPIEALRVKTVGDPLAAVGPRGPVARAWEAIDVSPDVELWVLERDEKVVGVAQLVFVPGLNWNGALRAQLQAVRVARSERGHGVGTDFLNWLLVRAHARGATLVQLASDRRRVDAHRWYERHGFVPSHVGFKKSLTPNADDHA
jgi:GNAT superfamily N-acetyltransferase